MAVRADKFDYAQSLLQNRWWDEILILHYGSPPHSVCPNPNHQVIIFPNNVKEGILMELKRCTSSLIKSAQINPEKISYATKLPCQQNLVIQFAWVDQKGRVTYFMKQNHWELYENSHVNSSLKPLVHNIFVGFGEQTLWE